MSNAQIQKLHMLGDECRRLLKEVSSGTPADFLRFSDEFDEILASLPEPKDLESLPPGEQQDIRRVLKDVERVRKQLTLELTNIRSDLVSKLTEMSKGQQGLDAYRKTLGIGKGGTRRGSV